MKNKYFKVQVKLQGLQQSTRTYFNKYRKNRMKIIFQSRHINFNKIMQENKNIKLLINKIKMISINCFLKMTKIMRLIIKMDKLHLVIFRCFLKIMLYRQIKNKVLIKVHFKINRKLYNLIIKMSIVLSINNHKLRKMLKN